jgi:hypothetical protein
MTGRIGGCVCVCARARACVPSYLDSFNPQKEPPVPFGLEIG